MANRTTYGKCSGCGRWSVRDEMLSINTDVYDASNRREVIRQRYCPACYEQEVARLRRAQWRWKVVDAAALVPMPDGSFPSDEVILERDRRMREDSVDSEAAFRSRGVPVPEPPDLQTDGKRGPVR